MELDADLKALQDVRVLLRRAAAAQAALAHFTQAQVDRLVEAMADAARTAAVELAEAAVAETGFGRAADKAVKNRFAAEQVAACLRGQTTVGVLRSDPERRLVEIAVPAGVVAAIIPATNPTSTTIFKSLIALKARNAVVFSPHPAARACIARTAALLAGAATAAGAPEGAIGCLDRPTLAATEALMRHPLTGVVLATGGQGLVRAAYSSGKPAFGVGPGNVPAFIERTANPESAVDLVLAGKCFDYGTVCASEQAVVVDAPLAEAVRTAFRKRGAHFCTPEEKAKLERVMVVDGAIDPAVVGRAAPVIAARAGFSVPPDTPVLVVPMDRVGPDEPLSREKLSPVLSWFDADGWQAACHICLAILEHGGVGHTLVIHSADEEVVMRFAMEKPAFRILVNTPGTHGAIGLTTALTPSLTLGCGTWGNNITTDNITARHLINVRRLAWGLRPPTDQPARSASHTDGFAADTPPATTPAPPPFDREAVRALVRQALNDLTAPADCPTTPTAPQSAPGDFWTESDIRQALATGHPLTLTRDTRLTPAARDLAQAMGLLERD